MPIKIKNNLLKLEILNATILFPDIEARFIPRTIAGAWDKNPYGTVVIKTKKGQS